MARRTPHFITSIIDLSKEVEDVQLEDMKDYLRMRGILSVQEVKAINKFSQIYEKFLERNLSVPNELCSMLEDVRRLDLAEKLRDLFTGAGSITETTNISYVKETFLSELQAKYRAMYDAVQPIPYLKDRYCVDKVFVNTGIEFEDRESIPLKWIKLESHHNLSDEKRTDAKRQIIEGEPGYGKSTITLQMTYDWCNKSKSSPLKDVDILIHLRLRQLKGLKSIYEAIKLFLLPRDTSISHEMIEKIVKDSTSVVILLDGYDEYPEQGDDESFVSLMMKQDLLLSKVVILTTRSFFLPNDYVPQTKRIRLTGFNDESRDKYIHKVVTRDRVEADKVKQKLRRTAILADLCDVPLFFVMSAHMTYEDETFENITTVTGFFRYMISCFHAHLRNKLKNNNVQSTVLEADHRKLDKVAFDALIGKTQQIIWRKDDLLQQLGKDSYEQYVRVGILVEEEDLRPSDGLVHQEYQREVRFYHKLFCEWYAAHHLGKVLEETDTSGHSKGKQRQDALIKEYFSKLDPDDLQYVYRFASGINKKASQVIVKHFQDTKSQRFAILCLLEQEGKIDNILGTVEDLVAEKILIAETDNRLLQRSTKQILELASKEEIYIKHLYLSGTFKAIDKGDVILSSDIRLPGLNTLETLEISTTEGRIFDHLEFIEVLKYASESKQIKALRVWYSVLPKAIAVDCIPSSLRSRNVEVVWFPFETFNDAYNEYRLEMNSGKWLDQDEEILTDKTYAALISNK